MDRQDSRDAACHWRRARSASAARSAACPAAGRRRTSWRTCHVRRGKLPVTSRARSRAEFVAKLAIVVEEADETVYWLELAGRVGLGDPAVADQLLAEARELRAISPRCPGASGAYPKLTDALPEPPTPPARRLLL